jgi:hypothetical protein
MNYCIATRNLQAPVDKENSYQVSVLDIPDTHLNPLEYAATALSLDTAHIVLCVPDEGVHALFREVSCRHGE